MTLSKFFFLFWGLSFLIFEMGIITSHSICVRICAEVIVKSACYTKGFEPMACLTIVIMVLGEPRVPAPKTASGLLLSFFPDHFTQLTSPHPLETKLDRGLESCTHPPTCFVTLGRSL